MSEEREMCGATLVLGSVVFVCQLRSHDGRHSAEGKQDGHSYFIMWEGDMKAVEIVQEPMVMNPT